MEHIDFTPRNVAKHVVKAAIAFKVSRTVKHKINDYAGYDTDNFIVDQTGFVVGWYVSDKLKPYTDKAVDWTADRIVAYVEKKKSQDKTPETEK